MGQTTGRRTALILLAGGLLVLAAAAVALRDPIRETWYLRKLDRGTAEEKREILARLGALGLPRSAARLAEIAWKGGDEIAEDSANGLRSWPKPIPPWAFKTPITALADADPDIWERALSFLQGLQRAPGPALAALLAGEGEPSGSWRARFFAAVLLGRPGGDPAVAVPALAGALADPTLLVRLAAVRGLARFGPAAAPAIPALKEVLRKDTFDVRFPAWRAIEAIRGDRPTPLADFWKERKGPCEHPLPAALPPEPRAEAGPPAEALPAADLDRIIAGLKARPQSHVDCEDALAARLIEARDWPNPELDRLFEGETLGVLFEFPDPGALVRAWTALLEESGCTIDARESRGLAAAVMEMWKARRLVAFDDRPRGDVVVDRARLNTSGWWDREPPAVDEAAGAPADEDGEAVIRAGIDAQTVFLFREFLAQLRMALDPDDFAKLAAVLRAVHIQIPSGPGSGRP